MTRKSYENKEVADVAGHMIEMLAGITRKMLARSIGKMRLRKLTMRLKFWKLRYVLKISLPYAFRIPRIVSEVTKYTSSFKKL